MIVCVSACACFSTVFLYVLVHALVCACYASLHRSSCVCVWTCSAYVLQVLWSTCMYMYVVTGPGVSLCAAAPEVPAAETWVARTGLAVGSLGQHWSNCWRSILPLELQHSLHVVRTHPVHPPSLMGVTKHSKIHSSWKSSIQRLMGKILQMSIIYGLGNISENYTDPHDKCFLNLYSNDIALTTLIMSC